MEQTGSSDGLWHTRGAGAIARRQGRGGEFMQKLMRRIRKRRRKRIFSRFQHCQRSSSESISSPNRNSMGHGVPEVLTNSGAILIPITAETSFDIEDVCDFQFCDEVCAVELC